MVKDQSSWSLIDGVPHCEGTPIILTEISPKAETRPPLYKRRKRQQEMLVKVLKGEQFEGEITKLQSSLQAILRLKIPDQSGETDTDRTKRAQRHIEQLDIRSYHRHRSTVSSFEKSTEPTTLDRDNRKLLTFQDWDFDPETNELFFNDIKVEAADFIKAAILLAINEFPEPIKTHDLEHLAQIFPVKNNPALGASRLENMFTAKMNAIKIEHSLQVPPIVRQKGTDSFYLITDLTSLTPEQIRAMDLASFGKLTVSNAQKVIWIDGKIADTPKNGTILTSGQMPLVDFFIREENRGRHVRQSELNAASLTIRTGISQKINGRLSSIFGTKSNIGLMRIGTDGGFFYTSQEEHNQALLLRKQALIGGKPEQSGATNTTDPFQSLE